MSKRSAEVSIPYLYGEDDEQAFEALPNKKSKEDDLTPTEAVNMTEREKKLFQLRMKLNNARKNNYEQVAEEEKRKGLGEKADSEKIREQWKETKEKEKEEMIKQGLNPEVEEILSTTATEAEWKARHNEQKKKKAGFGWDMFNPESHYNAYKKRMNDLEITQQDYAEQKEKIGNEEDFFRDAHNLNHGNAPEIKEERVNKMVAELEKSQARRKNFHRRRTHLDEEYVTYVNDRNRQFNKKAARAFDPYTTEIKQNLERGTAV